MLASGLRKSLLVYYLFFFLQIHENHRNLKIKKKNMVYKVSIYTDKPETDDKLGKADRIKALHFVSLIQLDLFTLLPNLITYVI